MCLGVGHLSAHIILNIYLGGSPFVFWTRDDFLYFNSIRDEKCFDHGEHYYQLRKQLLFRIRRSEKAEPAISAEGRMILAAAGLPIYLISDLSAPASPAADQFHICPICASQPGRHQPKNEESKSQKGPRLMWGFQ